MGTDTAGLAILFFRAPDPSRALITAPEALLDESKTNAATVSGPEGLTVPERLVRLTHLPYWAGCLIVAILAGGPGAFAVFYLDGLGTVGAWDKTVTVIVLSVFSTAQPAPYAEGVAEVFLGTLALFIDMYLTRYLRRKVVEAGPQLSQISTGGEPAYRRAFHLVSNPWGTLLFTALFVLFYLPARVAAATGAWGVAGMTIGTVLASLVYGAAFWAYVSALWGVHRFGLGQLNLKRFYEDRMLGLRPLGQIVVTYAVTFSVAITLTLGNSLLRGDVGTIAVNLAIVGFGLVMLFLPLRGIHRKMIEVKGREVAILSSRSKDFLAGVEGGPAAARDADSKIEQLLELQKYQAMRTEASMISEWPFDTRLVERLIGLLLAIFTVILARLLQVAM